MELLIHQVLHHQIKMDQIMKMKKVKQLSVKTKGKKDKKLPIKMKVREKKELQSKAKGR